MLLHAPCSCSCSVMLLRRPTVRTYVPCTSSTFVAQSWPRSGSGAGSPGFAAGSQALPRRGPSHSLPLPRLRLRLRLAFALAFALDPCLSPIALGLDPLRLLHHAAPSVCSSRARRALRGWCCHKLRESSLATHDAIHTNCTTQYTPCPLHAARRTPQHAGQ
jgi:hypothetical protein